MSSALNVFNDIRPRAGVCVPLYILESVCVCMLVFNQTCSCGIEQFMFVGHFWLKLGKLD